MPFIQLPSEANAVDWFGSDLTLLLCILLVGAAAGALGLVLEGLFPPRGGCDDDD